MQDRRVARPVPAMAWLLFAAAAIQLAAYVAHNWYRFFGPFPVLRFDDLLAATWLVAPFLIAAAALVAASRWPARRRWIVAGVGLLAVHGVIGSVNAAGWAWFPPVTAPSPAAQALFVSLNLVNSAVIVAAPLCLAIGIGRPRADLPPMTGGRGVVTAAIGVGVAIGLTVGLRLLDLELGLVRTQGMEWWFGPVTVSYRLLTTLLVVGFGLLAVAAVRVVPPFQVLPELVIALAVLVAVGAAIGWHFQWLMFELGPEGSGDIPYPLPMAVGALGYLLLIVGFALAAIGVWRRARA